MGERNHPETSAVRHCLKPNDKLREITSHVRASTRLFSAALQKYPRDILDLLIYHKLHFHMSPRDAAERFRRLKNVFVDWNEVRISSIKEIQEVFHDTPDSLELAIFIKDFLEQIHRLHQTLSLEFLAEENSADIRKHLKELKGVDPSSIDMVLRLRKELPVVPLSPAMDLTLQRVGLVKRGEPRDRKARQLNAMLSPELVLPFHHFFLEHSREICPTTEADLRCPVCSLQRSCSYFAKHRKRLGARQRKTKVGARSHR